jgi:hypothetical protein
MNIFNQDNSSEAYSSNNITLTTENDLNMLLFSTLSLPEDHYYWINIAIWNYTGESNNKSLSTFDVQNVEVSNNCFSVKFIKGHVATGCHITLQCIPDFRKDFNVTVLDHVYCIKMNDSEMFSSTIEVICTLRAYDQIGSTIQKQNGPAIKLENVVITTTIPTTTLPILSSTTPTSSSIVNPTNIQQLPIIMITFASVGGAALQFIVIIIICTIITISIILLYRFYKNTQYKQSTELITPKPSFNAAENTDSSIEESFVMINQSDDLA